MQSVRGSRCSQRGRSIAFLSVTEGGHPAVRRRASGVADVLRAKADRTIVRAGPTIVPADRAAAADPANRRVNRVWVELAGVSG